VAQPRIKILFLIDQLSVAGTEKQLAYVADNLQDGRFAVTVGVMRKNGCETEKRLKSKLVSFERDGMPFWRNIGLLKSLRSFIHREDFDIVQTHFPESEIYANFALRALKSRPIIIGTRRNLYHWIKEKPLYFSLQRIGVRWLDVILANSHKAGELCHRLEKVPRNKIRVIQNGVELKNFPLVPREQARQTLGLDNGKTVVGVVANWRPVKGLDTFLKAASILIRKVPQTIFVLASQGAMKAELEKISMDLGLADKVRF